jgi:ribosome-associated protein
MADLKIPIHTEFIELNQLLKLAGLASSGGAGKALVAAGGIRVDNKEELRKTAKIRVGQVVRAGDVRIRVVAAKPGAVAPPA